MAEAVSAQHQEDDSERRFRAVVECIPDTVVILNHQGKVLYANPAVRQLLGYAPEELVGHDAFSFVHPDDAPETLAIFTEDMRIADQTRSRTHRVLRKDGTVRVVETAGRTYRDRDGQIVAVVNIRDVTERQQVDEKLRSAEARFRSLFESMDEGFALCEMIYDDAGQPVNFRYLEVNPAFARLTGLPVERVVGRTVKEVIPGIEPFWVQTYARVVRTGQSERIHNPVAALEKVYEVHAWRPAAGHFAVVFSDMTERHNAEQALRESQHFAQEIINTTPNLLYIYDLVEQRSVYANREVTTVLGYTAQEVAAMGSQIMPRLVHPEDLGRVMEYHRSYVTLGDGEIRRVEYRMQHAGGDWRWLDSKETLFTRTPDGRPRQIIGTAVDITEQRLAEQALRQSEEHFRRLAESNQRLLHEVNHRVRNNLASLLSLLELIRPKARDVDGFARAMHNRILAMTRIHNLLAGVGWGDVDLRSLIAGLLQSMEHLAPHRIPVALDGPVVTLRPRQAVPLAMSILELFANSCKHGAHTAPGGRLTIGWDLTPVNGRVTVTLWWRETGGPPADKPAAPSLGTELIEGFMKYELGGLCQLRYPPQGADHRFEFAVAAKDSDRTSFTTA
jgi:PAS domain S-box-containing protein